MGFYRHCSPTSRYHGYFINLIRTCISTPTFSVLVNGQPRLLFERNKVSAKAVTYRLTFLLLQLINCPIGFNLRCKIAIGQVSLWDFGSKLPPIHSMLFPDDVILCGNASVAEATTIRHIFQELSAASG